MAESRTFEYLKRVKVLRCTSFRRRRFSGGASGAGNTSLPRMFLQRATLFENK
jgi:hypothetical protein